MSKENKEKKEKRFVVLEEQRLHVGIIRILTNPTARRGGCVTTHNPIGST